MSVPHPAFPILDTGLSKLPLSSFQLIDREKR